MLEILMGEEKRCGKGKGKKGRAWEKPQKTRNTCITLSGRLEEIQEIAGSWELTRKGKPWNPAEGCGTFATWLSRSGINTGPCSGLERYHAS